jgi:hypothetical protein
MILVRLRVCNLLQATRLPSRIVSIYTRSVHHDIWTRPRQGETDRNREPYW